MGFLFAIPATLAAYFARLGIVRSLALLAGIALSGVLLISMATNLTAYIQSPPAPTAEHEFHREPKELALASDGALGHYNREQLQRGFQVYKEVCSACHSITHVSFHDLGALGYSEAEVKAIANQWQTEVPSVNPDTGEPATRKAVPSDRFPAVYANEVAGKAANNNALPPDLSLMAKAREGGPAYIYSILTGYQNQPAELLKKYPTAKTPPGLHYNPYFANLNFAMPPPLSSEGQVSYADGTKSTVDQMAQDVAAFLMWTAEPKLENRHRWGLAVLLFLLIATILGYMSYQNIWATAKRKVAPVGVLDPENQAKVKRAKRKQGVAG